MWASLLLHGYCWLIPKVLTVGYFFVCLVFPFIFLKKLILVFVRLYLFIFSCNPQSLGVGDVTKRRLTTDKKVKSPTSQTFRIITFLPETVTSFSFIIINPTSFNFFSSSATNICWRSHFCDTDSDARDSAPQVYGIGPIYDKMQIFCFFAAMGAPTVN